MDRVVVVLGASGDIGEAISLKFAENNDKLVLCYNKNMPQAIVLAKKIRKMDGVVITKQVDLSSNESVKKVMDDIVVVLGKIDVLVCAHGIADYNILIDDKDENIKEVINVNLLGTIYANKYAANYMIKQQGGKIINISSIWGEVGGSAESVYSASKAGIIGFSKALAKELGLSNINVNVVSPGVIGAGMCKKLDKKTMKELAEQTAIGRVGTPNDVANAVYFLASDEASYITGEVIDVNGGMI